MENFVKEHPKSTVTAFLLFLAALLQWLDVFGGVWSAFSSTPLFLALKEWWPTMTYEWYWSLTLALRLGMLGLLIVIFFRVRQRRKETDCLKELQSKLSALEDTQPHLEASYVTEYPRLTHPSLMRQRPGVTRPASFALLRITNNPKSHNSQAIAYNLYAWVSYCDERWTELIRPTPKGVWVRPDRQNNNLVYIGDTVSQLDPHHSTYLGIVFKDPWQDTPQHYAIDNPKHKYRNWMNPAYQLPHGTTNIKVMVGCHNFQATSYYTLKSQDSDNDIQLEPRTPPITQWTRFWPILLYFLTSCFHPK